MRALIQLYIANLKEFSRERMSLFWTFAFPITFMALFGIIFSGDNGNTTFNIGVALEDQGQVGSSLAKAIQSVGAFKVTEGSQADLMAKLKKGDLQMVIDIPAGLSNATTAGQTTKVGVYYDPSSQTTAQILLPIIGKVVDSFDQQISHQPTLVTIDPRSVASSNLRTIDFLLPGILGMSLMQLGLFATATVLVQLREQQVLRRLGATPLPRATLLTSQVLFRLTVGMIQALSIILVGVLFFHVQIQGNPLYLFGIVLLGSMMFVALGYLISGLARTQESVAAITNLVNFPMMFLSGLFFPITLMPNWIRPVVNIMPLTSLADLLRQVMIGAAPVYPQVQDLAVLAGWLAACSVLAIKFFRWE